MPIYHVYRVRQEHALTFEAESAEEALELAGPWLQCRPGERLVARAADQAEAQHARDLADQMIRLLGDDGELEEDMIPWQSDREPEENVEYLCPEGGPPWTRRRSWRSPRPSGSRR
jgi:hypothetical protein